MKYVLIPLMIALFSSISLFFRNRADKKEVNSDVIRTRIPKVVYGLYYFAGILFLAIGIVMCFLTEGKTLLLGLVVCWGLSFLALFGILWSRYNYVVVDDQGVTVYKLFCKAQWFSFSQIRFIKDTTVDVRTGSLKGYDENRKKLFSIDAMSVGVKAIAERLRSRGAKDIY